MIIKVMVKVHKKDTIGTHAYQVMHSNAHDGIRIKRNIACKTNMHLILLGIKDAIEELRNEVDLSKEGKVIVMVTESNLVDYFNTKVRKWKKNNWCKSIGKKLTDKEIAYKELWSYLLDFKDECLKNGYSFNIMRMEKDDEDAEDLIREIIIDEI